MAMFENELTLPGVITEIVADYSAGYDTSEWGTTDSVTILGTAFNGPVGEEVKVYTPEQARYIFGEAYDPTTKRQASLVGEIYDVWEKGCRTIYAVRVSGQEMYKDFELAVETDLKLRVSGCFPHNNNKDCFMTFKGSQGSEYAYGTDEGILRIYKPANRTTVAEKLAGVANSVNSILVTELNLDNLGFTKDSRLIDLINLVNEYSTNNVIKLSLVDENGVARASSTKEVQELTVGCLFPGIYTICREEAAKDIVTVTDVEVVRSADSELYAGCDATLWKKLLLNTDPSKPYPIGASNLGRFKKALSSRVLNVDSDFNFLKDIGVIDYIATKNTTDYEEVDIDSFDLYNRLGSGYVRTAKLKEVGVDAQGTTKYKVIPTPDGDSQKTIGLEDGIYSMLQMHETDYTVLAAANAETEIKTKLPKKTEFLRAQGCELALYAEFRDEFSEKTLATEQDSGVTSERDEDLITELKRISMVSATCKVDEKDIKAQRALYDFEVNYLPIEDLTQEEILDNLISEKFVRIPTLNTPNKAFKEGVKKGTLAFCPCLKKIQIFDGKKFVNASDNVVANAHLLVEERGELAIFKQVNGNEYERLIDQLEFFQVDSEGNYPLYVYFTALTDDIANVYALALTGEIIPLMSLKDLADETLKNEDYKLVAIEAEMPVLDCDNKTYIRIHTNEIEYCSVEEFVKELSEIKALAKKFDFMITDEGMNYNDEFPQSGLKGRGYNRKEELIYDVTLRLPFTTTDNFARHLAQHCLYTSLKSYPTHGIIGCSRLQGVSLNNIATRVNEICEMDLDMYAKKPNGNYMLDSNNEPHPIGRCVSVVFMQNDVAVNGYSYPASGCSSYAGMISKLDADRSSTGQPIKIKSQPFSLSNYQLTRLNNAGIVCCRESSSNGIVVVDGITQAPVSSVYRRLSTTKIINVVCKVLKKAIEPFIGLPQTLAYMNSMETAVKSAMNSLVGVLINNYNYTIVTDTASAKLGIVKINYNIVPVYEIRQVYNSVTVTETI